MSDREDAAAPAPGAGGAGPAAATADLLRGSAAVGAATVAERGLAFVGNLLAARIAGPSDFGTYALLLSTASTATNYAGAGVGTTAVRFAGRHPPGGAGHARLVRSVQAVAAGAAAISFLVLALAAGPIAASVLGSAALAPLLVAAGATSAALVVWDAGKGMLLGGRRNFLLVQCTLVAGGAAAVGVPFAARWGPGAMVLAYGAGWGAMGVVALAARAAGGDAGSGEGPRAGEILRFGLVQLASVAGLALASWVLAARLCTVDESRVQMGLFAVGGQLRNLASAVPGILATASLPLLARGPAAAGCGGGAEAVQATQRASAALSILGAGALLAALPWALRLYGPGYAGAATAASILLVVAVVHMGGVAAANRLMVLRVGAYGAVNAAWAALVLGGAVLLVPRYGAVGAAVTLLAAHVVSDIANTVLLARLEPLPTGFLPVMLLRYLWLAGAGIHVALVAAGARATGLREAGFAAFTAMFALLIARRGAR